MATSRKPSCGGMSLAGLGSTPRLRQGRRAPCPTGLWSRPVGDDPARGALLRRSSALRLRPEGDRDMAAIRDVYSRITDKIIADLEQGVRPWLKPWNPDHAAGRITRPLRHNGIPYKATNVVMLWSASVSKGYACPLWLSDFAGAPRQSIC